MLEITNLVTSGWEAAIRGMRNPKSIPDGVNNSWDKADSHWTIKDGVSLPTSPNDFIYELGPNDSDLACRLIKAGTEHAKFLRMIHVQMDIIAPLFWVAEHDTYKVGTTRNSCSFMHKGLSKPFEISDFSISDEKISYLLSPIKKEKYKLVYPYETEEYKIYTCHNGRQYKVFKNSRVFSCPFSYTDTWGTGRTRTFPEKEVKPSLTKHGYYELNLGGRDREKWMLHRLVAFCWIDNPSNLETVNHINGKKWENNVENLEWMSRSDNIIDGYEQGVYDQNALHRNYIAWKNGHSYLDPLEKIFLINDYENKKITRKEIQEKYNLTLYQVNAILAKSKSPDIDLFTRAYTWEKVISSLNELRDIYLETKDEKVFQAIRQLLPQGYNVTYTWDSSMQTILNIIQQRKNHRLLEWEQFRQACFENIPYCKEFYEAM